MNIKQVSLCSIMLGILFLNIYLSTLAISGTFYTTPHITTSNSDQPSQPETITLEKQISYDNYATLSIKVYNESLTVSLTLDS